MELSTVEIPRAGARQLAADYRRQAKRERDPERQREFAEIARAYRIAAADEVPLITLTPTIVAGGTVTRTRVCNRGTERERHVRWLLPALAVAPATASFVYTLGIDRDGSLELSDRLAPHWRYSRGIRVFPVDTFILPSGYEPGRRLTSWTSQGWSAMVPIVPPKHQPARGLGNRLILWEVENWTWATVPPPPGDPALLRYVGGDIYAVEAVWDLTPLEQLVLSGRRP